MQDRPTKKPRKVYDFIFIQAIVHTIFTKSNKCSKDMEYEPRKVGLAPRNSTLLLRETLANRFQRPSSQPSFLLPTLSDRGDAQVCKKSNIHTLALPCLSSYCSSFYSLGGSLHPSRKLAPLKGSRQTKPVLPELSSSQEDRKPPLTGQQQPPTWLYADRALLISLERKDTQFFVCCLVLQLFTLPIEI